MDSQRKQLRGTALPLPGNDIDTDRIIPARYLRCVTFDQLGQYAFYDERFDEQDRPKVHPFNDKRYQKSSILLVNENFGCGSSREHAPQSLMRWGIKAFVGESFAEIFFGNCTALGLPAVSLSREDIEVAQKRVEEEPATLVEIDLETKRVIVGGVGFNASIRESARMSLVTGAWDTTAILLEGIDQIKETAAGLPYLQVTLPEVPLTP